VGGAQRRRCLARHLGAFGEIRITRLEPETAVAWEGERARGTVELEPSGWGTRVTLTARLAARPEPAPTPQQPPEPVPAPQPHAEPSPQRDMPPAKLRALLRRLFDRRPRPPAPTARPEAPTAALAPSEPYPPPPANPAPRQPAPPVPDPTPGLQRPRTTEPAPLDAGRAEQILFGVLDDLGAARHRPFSRG
jgi:hypothetical protein